MSGHLVTTKTKAEKTDPAWLKATGQVGRFVNERADRDDIIAFLGEGAGEGHAACFCPDTAEIDLNVQVCFGAEIKPSDVGDVNDRATLYEWPVVAGALTHEAGHARWTLWDLHQLEDLIKERKNTLASGLVQFFEEGRIESLAARQWPEDRVFLRASAISIVMADMDLAKLKEGSPYEVSRSMLLTVARHDAGVLAEEDVEDLREFFIEFFTEEVYRKFRTIWLESQLVGRYSSATTRFQGFRSDHEEALPELIKLADRWLELLPEDPDFADERMKSVMEMMDELEKMMADAEGSAEVGAGDEAADQQVAEVRAAQTAAKEADAKEAQSHSKVAEQIFGPMVGLGDIPEGDTRSRVIRKRAPSTAERAAAIEIGRQLEKARYRDRVVTDVNSELPPGRLHTGEAMQGLAQRSKGQMVTVKPWGSRLRKHVEDPKLKIGVMVDISSSMTRAMEPMAVAAWVLAEAGHRIQAEVAQVYFGASVFPTLKPGQRMPEVIVYSATDGVERFRRGFQALDGKLNLLRGSGARLLVICSDLGYSGSEPEALRVWTTRCIQAGVGVLILPFDAGYYVHDKTLNPHVQIIPGTMDPAAAATAIGRAGVKALELAGKRR